MKVICEWHQERSLKMEAKANRKARRSRLLKKHKAEIESESIGLSEYRKMRLARLLDRTQTFWNSGRRRRTGPTLILEPGLFIQKRIKNGSTLEIKRRLEDGRTGPALILQPSWFARGPQWRSLWDRDYMAKLMEEGVDPGDIEVIAPYRRQVLKLREGDYCIHSPRLAWICFNGISVKARLSLQF